MLSTFSSTLFFCTYNSTEVLLCNQTSAVQCWHWFLRNDLVNIFYTSLLTNKEMWYSYYCNKITGVGWVRSWNLLSFSSISNYKVKKSCMCLHISTNKWTKQTRYIPIPVFRLGPLLTLTLNGAAWSEYPTWKYNDDPVLKLKNIY